MINSCGGGSSSPNAVVLDSSCDFWNNKNDARCTDAVEQPPTMTLTKHQSDVAVVDGALVPTATKPAIVSATTTTPTKSESTTTIESQQQRSLQQQQPTAVLVTRNNNEGGLCMGHPAMQPVLPPKRRNHPRKSSSMKSEQRRISTTGVKVEEESSKVHPTSQQEQQRKSNTNKNTKALASSSTTQSKQQRNGGVFTKLVGSIMRAKSEPKLPSSPPAAEVDDTTTKHQVQKQHTSSDSTTQPSPQQQPKQEQQQPQRDHMIHNTATTTSMTTNHDIANVDICRTIVARPPTQQRPRLADHRAYSVHSMGAQSTASSAASLRSSSSSHGGGGVVASPQSHTNALAVQNQATPTAPVVHRLANNHRTDSLRSIGLDRSDRSYHRADSRRSIGLDRSDRSYQQNRVDQRATNRSPTTPLADHQHRQQSSRQPLDTSNHQSSSPQPPTAAAEIMNHPSATTARNQQQQQQQQQLQPSHRSMPTMVNAAEQQRPSLGQSRRAASVRGVLMSNGSMVVGSSIHPRPAHHHQPQQHQPSNTSRPMIMDPHHPSRGGSVTVVPQRSSSTRKLMVQQQQQRPLMGQQHPRHQSNPAFNSQHHHVTPMGHRHSYNGALQNTTPSSLYMANGRQSFHGYSNSHNNNNNNPQQNYQWPSPSPSPNNSNNTTGCMSCPCCQRKAMMYGSSCASVGQSSMSPSLLQNAVTVQGANHLSMSGTSLYHNTGLAPPSNNATGVPSTHAVPPITSRSVLGIRPSFSNTSSRSNNMPPPLNAPLFHGNVGPMGGGPHRPRGPIQLAPRNNVASPVGGVQSPSQLTSSGMSPGTRTAQVLPRQNRPQVARTTSLDRPNRGLIQRDLKRAHSARAGNAMRGDVNVGYNNNQIVLHASERMEPVSMMDGTHS